MISSSLVHNSGAAAVYEYEIVTQVGVIVWFESPESHPSPF